MNTTISISKETKQQIIGFGNKDETYDEILKRILDSVKERQIQEILLNEKNTIPIKKALDKAKKIFNKEIKEKIALEHTPERSREILKRFNL